MSSTRAYSGIGEFSVSFKRQTQVYWTVQGTQTPFVIARGPLNDGREHPVGPDEHRSPLDLMLLNAAGPDEDHRDEQPGIPNSGTPFTLTFNEPGREHQVEDHAEQGAHRVRELVRRRREQR